MPLTKANLEVVIRLASAVLQRYEQINQLSTGLTGAAIYRSPDGKIAIAVTPEQLAQVDDALTQLLNDADAASVAIRGLIGSSGPGPHDVD